MNMLAARSSSSSGHEPSANTPVTAGNDSQGAITVQADAVGAEAWGELSSAFSDHNIYQTWAFGGVSAEQTKSQVCRAIVRRGEAVIGLAQLRIKRIPFLGMGVAYVFRGPLWRCGGARPDDLREVLALLRQEFCRLRGLNLRVLPNLIETAGDDDDVTAALALSGFAVDFDAPRERTILLDLSPSLAELRKGLEQKWRNGLNQAEKRGLRVVVASDEAAMSAFESLYERMWSRKQFETGVHVGSFTKLQTLLAPGERMRVLLAYQGDEPAAGHVSSTLGDTCIYLLGASNDLGRANKASYLLQWKAIELAQSAGARWYNLGGIDPAGNPGVYHFKAGLGGKEVRFLESFSAPGGRAARWIVPLAERFYRRLRSNKDGCGKGH
ncbi:MAG: peptidoglycan bridge formation glycyltransferase FemA/FemB family protein [Planctomycetota bacterium]